MRPALRAIALIATGPVLLLALSGVTSQDVPSDATPAALEAVESVHAPLGTGFTFQGNFSDAAGGMNGTCSLTFTAWDAVSGGSQLGGPESETSVPLTDGFFTVTLNEGGTFGSSFYKGDARWLEVSAQCPPGSSAETLAPRQPLTGAPFAHHAADTAALGGHGPLAFQRRLTAPCPPGTQLRPLNAGGATICQRPVGPAPSAPQVNLVSTVDSAGNVGIYSSITIGADGLGLISYVDGILNYDLKVAHCNNSACTSTTTTTIDSTGDVGVFTSIAIGADGLGLISYRDGTNDDLKVAHCADAACTSAIITTLDSAGNVGYFTSIAIGADGLGLISYYDGDPNYDLKVAHCDNAACTSATTTTIDSAGYVGSYNSIAIGADGLGLISYLDGAPNSDLKVAHCNNPACSSADISTLDSAEAVGQYTSIAIGADGLGLISYYDTTYDNLKVAHCYNTACSGVNARVTIDSAEAVGLYTSIAIGADGLGLISYYDDTNDDLKVAHCADVACTSATITTLDSAGKVGYYASIAIGADGLGLISYHDSDPNYDLKVAHCANAACSGTGITTLDSAGIVGRNTFIAIGADGLGLISYSADANSGLRVAHCNDLNCTGATLTTLDGAGYAGHASIAIGVDGLGLVSYTDYNNHDLKVAHCTDIACTSATFTTLDSAYAGDTSVAIGADGLGLISYEDHIDDNNGHLKVAHCLNVACTTATLTTVDSAGYVGAESSITIGTDGLGLISYRDVANFDLKVAHCNNAACTGATTATVDSAGRVGAYPSIAIGADGLALISHYDANDSDLKVTHCDNPACTSATSTTLVSEDVVASGMSITIGGDGVGLISYADEVYGDLKVAHCSNAACTSATTTIVDRAGDVGYDASITIGTDGLGLVSYFDDSETALKVAHCDTPTCRPWFLNR